MTCRNCEYNDDLLCDKYGVLVEDDDECFYNADERRPEPGGAESEQNQYNPRMGNKD